jgi:hypothetical protein
MAQKTKQWHEVSQTTVRSRGPPDPDREHLPENKKSHIHMIMEEKDVTAKGYRIDDIAWLKSKDKLDTAEAAEWVINNGLVFRQRYIDSIVQYQVKEKRCHRCQKMGHLA